MIALNLVVWVLLILLLVILLSQFLIEGKINKVKKIKQGNIQIKTEVIKVNREPTEKKIIGLWNSSKKIINDLKENNKEKQRKKLRILVKQSLDDARDKEVLLKNAIQAQNMDVMVKTRVDFIEAKRKAKKLLNELERLG